MTNTIHSGDLWTFQDRTKSSFLMGPQSLPGWQGHSPSLLLHDAPGPPLAQDPRIHRGIATCCPGEVMAPLGPAHHLQTLIEQQVQGPAFPGGHQRGFCVRRKKRNSRKTFLVSAVPPFSQSLATLVALIQSKTSRTYYVPGTVLALGMQR